MRCVLYFSINTLGKYIWYGKLQVHVFWPVTVAATCTVVFWSKITRNVTSILIWNTRASTSAFLLYVCCPVQVQTLRLVDPSNKESHQMFKNKNHKSGKRMTLGRPACSYIQMIQGLPIRTKCLAYSNVLCVSHTAVNKE